MLAAETMLVTIEELGPVPATGHGTDTARRATFEAAAKGAIPTLYGMARRLAGEEAEDLVQECLLRAFRSFGELQEQGSGTAWMRSILLNVHRDRLRARDRRPHEIAVDDLEWFSLYRTLADEDPFPYSDTMHADFLGAFSREDVHAVLARLPGRYRVPLVLHYMDGYATEEIAHIVGAARGTVLAQLHRGRKLFERALWLYALETGLLEGSDVDG